jgi:hypothetical protein
LRIPRDKRWASLESVMLIIDVLETPILLDGTGVGEMDRMAVLHKCIDKPVPIECGLDDDPLELRLIGGKEREDRLPVVGEISVEDSFPFVINDRKVTILCMKINSTV